MTTLFFILSALLVVVAVAVLLVSVLSLVAQVRSTTRAGAESLARMKWAMADIREEENNISARVVLLKESAGEWPRSTVLPREVRTLLQSITALWRATALLSTLRMAPWSWCVRLMTGR